MDEYYISDEELDILEALFHSGTPQLYDLSPTGSGRYREGSGEHPYQHANSVSSNKRRLMAMGMSEVEAAKALGFKSSNELRQQISIEKQAAKAQLAQKAVAMREHGYSKTYIAEYFGVSEGTVRNALKNVEHYKADRVQKTAELLKGELGRKKLLDVGTGAELYPELNVSEQTLNAALKSLEEDGYHIVNYHVRQVTNPSNYTTTKVLCPKDIDARYISDHLDEIHPVTDFVTDDGYVAKTQYPSSLDSKRVYIRYDEDGGTAMDGSIQIRRGVPDLSLGKSNYAQVRICVDDNFYMKGMALYSDDIPEGYDVVYNVNKKRGTPPEKVFKPMKIDESTGKIDELNPFGAVISAQGQSTYIDKDGKEQLSPINKIREEGEWATWSKTLSAQMLSKQSLKLINTQLKLSYSEKLAEFDEINSLTNDTVKKALIKEFADECDSAAVHLKASPIKGQETKVILPVPQLKDNEIYAPTFDNGTEVALVRYPYAGPFETPVLKVNNKPSSPAHDILGNVRDAVGINPTVASQLSGADFDGDTVIVIPNRPDNPIASAPPLPGLKDFDPKASYPSYEGMPPMSKRQRGVEMGRITNLIGDMTLKGAPDDEIERAVKHSMVVIDAYKHNLDYKRSAVENNIKELKVRYQGASNKGASTLITRATAEQRVDRRKSRYKIDPETGEKIFETDHSHDYMDKNGNWTTPQIKSTRMYEVKDARELSTGHPKEEAYASYANMLKALGNKARLVYLNTQDIKQNSDAKKEYADEISSLKAKDRAARMNAPRERQAVLLARILVNSKIKDNPELTDSEHEEDLKKISSRAMADARARTGAGKALVEFTDREWEAVQKGAVSASLLTRLLQNADMDKVKQRAMPRSTSTVSAAKQNRVQALFASGYTYAEIAKAVNLSSSQVSNILNGDSK